MPPAGVSGEVVAVREADDLAVFPGQEQTHPGALCLCLVVLDELGDVAGPFAVGRLLVDLLVGVEERVELTGGLGPLVAFVGNLGHQAAPVPM